MDVFSERRRFLTADQLKLALSGLSSTRYMYIQGARVALKQYEAAMLREEPRVAQEALGAAFRAVERGKVRSLLDLMTTGYMRQGGQKTPETDPINHWQRCSSCLTVSCGQLMQLQSMSEPDAEQIRHIKEKIANDERNLEKAEADLTATDPLFYRAQRISSNILSLGGAARTIDKDTALLQYAFSAEDLCAWTITSSGIHQVHRTTLCENQLTQYIRQFHKKCSSGEPIPKHISNFLVNNLVKPFDDTISTYSRLIVVSMGVGYLIPFHALSWRGQPLTATHTITYLPSTSFLQFLQSSRPNTSIPLASLPHAGTEAEIIAGLFPHSTALTGDKATFEAVYDALPSHSILHFATHGHLNADVPMLSAVSLAYGKELTVAGLTELRLSASLVVLSACRTGEGKASAGDDVVGLVRALFVAGAKAVMATLWAVDDAATTALMTEFYRRISEGDEPAVALQYAQNFLRTCERGGLDEKLEKLSVQLEDQKARKGTIQNVRMLRMQAELAPEQALEKDYSHPMYWAPFMLMGV
ncbi:CHAT domain-containing protein [Leptodontidium sp. MPI-SDFR-AT-0119]|nr:CHAT domain-containing protein [Leptodontidium sp. MPI-SDFR-AT-0119]